jgi:hypothetical protein
MAIFRITRGGLSVIAALVVVLWGCFLTEQVITKRARLEHYRAMRQIERLKSLRQIEPVYRPIPVPIRHPQRRVIG